MLVRSRMLIFAVAAFLSVALSGCEKGTLSKHAEQTVAVSDVPAPVKATIVKQSGGGTVKEIGKRSQNGKTVYDVSLGRNDAMRRMTIAEDGALVATGKEEDDDDD